MNKSVLEESYADPTVVHGIDRRPLRKSQATARQSWIWHDIYNWSMMSSRRLLL